MRHQPWILKNRLLQALQEDDVTGAERIIDQGVDVDSVFYSEQHRKPAICVCVEGGHCEMAEMLIGRGCSLSLTTANGSTPLHLAVTYSNKRLVNLILQNRANVRALDDMGRTALHIACSGQSLDIVQSLIEMGSDCRKSDVYGNSPLLVSCINGSSEIASLLLRNGARVNDVSRDGNSPLIAAILKRNSLELIRDLIEAGANVNQENSCKETPIMALMKSYDPERNFENLDHLAIMTLLIRSGCELNITTSLGQTPLHLAVCKRSVNLTQRLLNSGCDPNATDDLGFPPLFYACRDGSEKIAAMLVATGAEIRRQKWVHDSRLFRNRDSEKFVNLLLEKQSCCQKLSEICVLSLRTYLHSRVESVTDELFYPKLLKDVINLNAYA